jgi:hypothetical protein
MPQILRDNEHSLSMEIVYKVCQAIDKDLASIDIAEIITPAEIITIHSTRPNYLDTLETNLQTLIKYEEYEVCAMAKTHIDLLKEKKSKKYLDNKK